MAEIKDDQKVYCHFDWPKEQDEAETDFDFNDNYQLLCDSKSEFNVKKSRTAPSDLVTDRDYRLSSDMVYFDQRTEEVGTVNRWYVKKV